MSNEYLAHIGHNQDQSTLLQITQLAEDQFAAQRNVERLEDELKSAKQKFQKLSEVQVPEAMEAAGLGDYTTTSGIHVEVKEKVRVNLPKEQQAQGYNWLENNGLGAAIESEVVVAFSRNELKEAQEFVNKLREEDKIANLERSVHHSRLDSILRERLAKGEDVPQDIFSIYRQRIAKVEV